MFKPVMSHVKAGNTSNIILAGSNVALQVEKCCCTYYHRSQTLPRNKLFLLQVEKIC